MRIWRWVFARIYLWCAGQWRRRPETVAVVVLAGVMGFILIELVVIGQWITHRRVGHFSKGLQFTILVALWLVNYLRFVRIGDPRADALIAELQLLDARAIRRELFKMWAAVGCMALLLLATMIALGYRD